MALKGYVNLMLPSMVQKIVLVGVRKTGVRSSSIVRGNIVLLRKKTPGS